MKLTKAALKQIIKEEMDAALREDRDEVSIVGYDYGDHLKPSQKLEKTFEAYLDTYERLAQEAIGAAGEPPGAEGDTVVARASGPELFNQVTKHLDRIVALENKISTASGGGSGDKFVHWRRGPRGWEPPE